MQIIGSYDAPPPQTVRAASSSMLIPSKNGPLTATDLDMLHSVYGEFGWPDGTEGHPIPALAFDIAEARNLLQAQGFQANLQSTATETILLKRFDTEHYDTEKLKDCLRYLKDTGVSVGLQGNQWLGSGTGAAGGAAGQYQDPVGRYL